MDGISGIYLIRNTVNNKIYIGQSKNIKWRWMKHRCELRGNRHANVHLQNAWNKYGEKAFVFEVVEEYAPKNLNDREVYWIKKYNSISNGYNLNIGGDGISGYKHSNDEINKMRASHNPKTILQFDKNFHLLNRWHGASHAAKTLKYCRESIDRCCHHAYNSTTYKECYWVFEDEYTAVDSFDWENYIKNNTPYIYRAVSKYDNKVSRKVDQYDLNWKYICTYPSITSAAFSVSAPTSNIHKALNSSTRTCKGYRWKYSD